MKVRLVYFLLMGLLLIGSMAGCAPTAMPALSIENAWGRPSMSMPTAGSIYMLINNLSATPDKLLSGKSPACGSIEIHETVMKMDGSMGMNLVDKPVEIPASGQVELKPGGLHIMCIMKKDDLFKPGAKINLTLTFEKSGDQTFPVEIRPEQ